MSRKVFKTIGTVAGIAALAVVTGGIGIAAASGLSIGAGIGLASAVTGLSGSLLVGGALMGLSTVLGLGPKSPKISPTSRDRLHASLDPSAPRKIVYGTTAMATDVRYHAYTGAEQEYYHQILCVASHAVESIDEIWFDNEIAWSSSGGVQGRYAGYLTVTPRLVGTSSNGIAIDTVWTAQCTLTGCAYVHLRFKLTGNDKKAESPFSSAVPTRVTVRGKGMKAYDPRLDSTVGGSGTQRANDQTTWAFSPSGAESGRNPALQLLNYLIGWRINGKLAVGRGMPADRFDMASFITAANMCDEPVTKAAGGTEPRYRSDGIFSEADDPSTVIDNLCAAMNAVLRDAGGKISLTVLHNDLASPIAHFDENDILGDESWQQTPPIDKSYNLVRGRFTDPSDQALYQLVDAPEVRIDSPDDIERSDSFDVPVCQSPSQWQRLAKQRLQRNLYQGLYAANFGARAWQVSLGQVVTFSHVGLGWDHKLFRVVSHGIAVNGVVPMALQEEHADIYAWDAEESPAVQAAVPTVYDPTKGPLVRSIIEQGDKLDTVEPGATVGAPPGTNVGNTPVETVEGVVGAVNDPTTGLAQQGQRLDQVILDVSELEATYGDTASASVSAQLAQQAADDAEAQALAAGGHASTASSEADAAAGSASAAEASAVAAQGFKDDAASSAASSSSSAAAASNSAASAATQASNAAGSATAAGNSASAASTSASQASTSASNAATSASSASSSANTATTKAGEAASSASSASSSAAAASSSAAAAFDSQVLSAAYRTGRGLNPNPTFTQELVGWVTANIIYQNSTTGAALGPSARSTTGNRGVLQSDKVPVRTDRKYRVYGRGYAATASQRTYIGVTCYGVDDANLGNVYLPASQGDKLGHFAVEGIITAEGGVPNGYGTAFITGTRTVRVLGYFNYNFEPTGYTLAAEVTIEDVTDVVNLEATVTSHSGAIADLDGRTLAYLQQTVNAGSGATAFVELKAETSPGNVTSSVALGAREVHIYNQVDGLWYKGMSIIGGNVTIDGDLTVGGSILLGNFRGRIGLEPIAMSVYDGQVISYGANLGSVPEITPDFSGFPALAAGESYVFRMDSHTPSGGIARVKKAGTGTVATQTSAAGTAGSGGPALVTHKPTVSDAYNGRYTFRVTGNMRREEQVLAEPPMTVYYGHIEFQTWFKPASTGVWTKGPVFTIFASDTPGATATIAYNQARTVEFGTALGQHATQEFGISIKSSAYPAYDTLTGLTNVQYQTTSATETTATPGNSPLLPIVIRPKNA